MSFSYRNLWITLEKNGISKTELRKRTGMSTATLAKLSSNQPVAMDVLGNICMELGCTLGDVVTYENETQRETAWSRISPDETYLVKLFYFLPDEESQAEYLYGFAAPFYLTEYGLDQWSLNQDEDVCCYMLDGYMTGEYLRRFLAMASDNRNMGEILEQLQITVKTRKAGVLDMVKASFMCNGRFVYRPVYIQPSGNTCRGMISECKPLQSFGDGAMFCESLFGLQKKRIYSSDGYVDAEKADAVWRFLNRHLPLRHSLNEMSRLNNFEVFFALDGVGREGGGIHWQILDHEDRETMKKIPDTFVLTLDHTRLEGKYGVNVILYNTENPFSDTLYILYCDEADAVLRLPLSEGVSSVGLKIWKMDEETAAGKLMFHEKSSFIRQFHLSLQMSGRKTVISDEWSRKMEKSGRKVEKEASFYTREDISIGNRDNEPWLSEEERVRKDFQEMMGMDVDALDGVFFQKDSDKAIVFLEWLKKTLDGRDIHRVILLDPYIEAESILKFIRCVGDTRIEYEIYTDSYAGGEKKKNEERIQKIRAIRDSLKSVMPEHFLVGTSLDTTNVLHDRYLILVGESLNPKVYVLSNSLDGMAKQHSSIVTQVNNRLARQVFDHYLNLLKKLQTDGKLETLCKSDGTFSGKAAYRVEAEGKLPFEAEPGNFRSHLFADSSAALSSLAYMHREEKEECYRYCMDQEQESMTDLLIQVLQKGNLQALPDGEERKIRHALALSQLLLKDFSQELLDEADQLLQYDTETGRYGDDWSLYYASKILWRMAPERFCDLLEELAARGKGYQTISFESRFEVSAQMISVLVFELNMYGLSERTRDTLLRAKRPFLRALGICRVLDLPREVCTVRPAEGDILLPDLISEKVHELDALEGYMEKLDAMIYLEQSLQVILCRHNYNSPDIQKYVDETGDHIALYLEQQMKEKGRILEPEVLYEHLCSLYMRNPEDICRIVKTLWRRQMMMKEAAEDILIRLCLEKYQKGMSRPDEYFRVDDILMSVRVIEYLAEVDVCAIGKLKKKMNKMERILAERLCRAFLKMQNYTLWKSSADLYTCLIYMEVTIAEHFPENYPINARTLAEYRKIVSNYADTLEKYSEVYRFAKGRIV